MPLRASELSQEMVNQLATAWFQVKGSTFPGGDTKDAEVMFRAVARGLLIYLEARQDMFSTITLSGGDPQGVAVDLNSIAEP